MMEHSSLYELIKAVQYGTKLHIGVCFFGKYYNEKLELPFEQTIHSSVVCTELKSRNGVYPKCFRCRNAALKKAVETRSSFGGLCINGIYEYTRPVVINDTVVCVVFVGNILSSDSGKIREKLGDKQYLIDELEKDFDIERCEATADVVESYIKLLMEKYPKQSEERRTAKLIEDIKSYIGSNIDIDISHAAQMFHYNERYLGRLFKLEAGQTFGEYLNFKRLERAKNLLSSCGDSIISISNRVGFNNVTYFNRLFKKMYGMTPSEYRQKQRD